MKRILIVLMVLTCVSMSYAGDTKMLVGARSFHGKVCTMIGYSTPIDNNLYMTATSDVGEGQNAVRLLPAYQFGTFGNAKVGALLGLSSEWVYGDNDEVTNYIMYATGIYATYTFRKNVSLWGAWNHTGTMGDNLHEGGNIYGLGLMFGFE